MCTYNRIIIHYTSYWNNWRKIWYFENMSIYIHRIDKSLCVCQNVFFFCRLGNLIMIINYSWTKTHVNRLVFYIGIIVPTATAVHRVTAVFYVGIAKPISVTINLKKKKNRMTMLCFLLFSNRLSRVVLIGLRQASRRSRNSITSEMPEHCSSEGVHVITIMFGNV